VSSATLPEQRRVPPSVSRVGRGGAEGPAEPVGDSASGDVDSRDLVMRRAGLDVRPISRIEEASPADVRRVVVQSRTPIVFTGLTDSWRARTEWTPERLATARGCEVVTPLMDLPAEGVLFPEDQRSYERTMPFREFLDHMLGATADAPCYLAYRRADDLLPSDDYDFAGLLGPLDETCDTRSWLGSVGTRSMLHSDLKDNLFWQVWGEKHVVLLDRKQSAAAYPFPDNIVNSRLDIARIDVQEFPKARRATFRSAILRPGDVLFIPRGVWHDFVSRSPSISLNHWFGPSLDARHYLALVARLGLRCWASTARGFLVHGVLGRDEPTQFFFSPPCTGKRLYDALRWGDFNRGNDPVSDGV
jgi:lysine-specific demethylase 8